LKSYFGLNNFQRPHQSLNNQTPAAIYFGILNNTVKYQKPAVLQIGRAADRRL
jgi:hypothetical protein